VGYVENPWAKHRQSAWRERAADTRNPDWLRLSSLAYAYHRGNGHACFDPGEIEKMLCILGTAVSRAIREAKERGWIADESNSRCLVVPPDKVGGGGDGHENDRCPVHRRKKRLTPSVKREQKSQQALTPSVKTLNTEC
jgi:hypothetical protein